MKVIVNAGRTVRVGVKGTGVDPDGEKKLGTRPKFKVYRPTNSLDLPNDEAKFLIERGFVREDKPIKEEADKDTDSGDKK